MADNGKLVRHIDIISPEEAALRVNDGDTIVTSGFLGSCQAEALCAALEKRFLETGAPLGLRLVFAASQGNRGDAGVSHFAHKHLLGGVIGGHWAVMPKLGRFVIDEGIEAYNFPQGVISQLYREIAAKRPGVITRTGLNTFVDPRHGGGLIAGKRQSELVSLIELDGKEYLFYRTLPLQVAFLRGSIGDECGNVVIEREGSNSDLLEIAQAVKNCGGRVIVQVEGIVKSGTLNPHLVKIPGMLVDALVIAPSDKHMQTYNEAFNPAYCSAGVPLEREACRKSAPPSSKEIIARRACAQLKPGQIANLGIGLPEKIAAVAAENGILGSVTLTVEDGVIGGRPASDLSFGMSEYPEAIISQASQFDFYDGGGLDIAFLGFAQMDATGNVNVSRFGGKLAGCGGFINISQSAKEIVFCGTFATKEEIAVENKKLRIAKEGNAKKLVGTVEQITFNAQNAIENGQHVMLITERAVFNITSRGICLVEIAPGLDLERDILSMMDFTPLISPELALMGDEYFV